MLSIPYLGLPTLGHSMRGNGKTGAGVVAAWRDRLTGMIAGAGAQRR